MNLAIFFKYISMSFQKKLSYRFELILEVFAVLFLRFCIAYFLWGAIFEYSGSKVLNGYSFSDMMMYYFMVPFVGKISKPRDMIGVSLEIYDGSLNKFLLYPSSYFFVKYAEFVALIGYYLVQFFIGAILFQYLFKLPMVSVFFSMNFAIYLGFALLANLLMFLMFLTVEQLAFWADHVWSLSVFIRFLTGILGGAMIPLSFFSAQSLAIIDYLPFRYFFSVPISILNGSYLLGNIYLDLTRVIVWIFVFYGLSQWIWSKGRWKYSGVGI